MCKFTRALVLFLTVLYVGLALLSALTMRPVCDEGWFSNPAVNLLTTGSMSTTVLDPTASFRGIRLQGIGRHTYWIMPLYILLQAGWYCIAGFSLVSLRLLSVLWGAVALLAWYIVLRRLSGSGAIALVAVLLLASDFHFQVAAGNGRMDMITFALGSAALAIYLGFRETHLTRAVVISHFLAAAAFFTHPLGLLYIGALAFISLYYDRKRLEPQHLALAAIPYAAGCVGWGLYILQSPPDFLAQLGTNASGRFQILHAPLEVLRREITVRYLDQYGLAPGTPPASHLKILVLLAYAAGVAAAFGTRSIRKDRGIRVLLFLTAWFAIGIMFLDSFEQPWYMVHLVPLPIALLAASAVHFWNAGRVPRATVAAVLCAVVAVQVLVSVSRAAKGERQDYMAAVNFLRPRLKQYRLVMASAEFGIPLKFDPRVLDDYRLGYYSGKTPDLVIMDDQRYGPWFQLLQTQDPNNYHYIQHLLSSYHLIYEHGAYRMYERSRTSP